jgi:hypothetical protein
VLGQTIYGLVIACGSDMITGRARSGSVDAFVARFALAERLPCFQPDCGLQVLRDG